MPLSDPNGKQVSCHPQQYLLSIEYRYTDRSVRRGDWVRPVALVAPKDAKNCLRAGHSGNNKPEAAKTI
jgi:hypothetical protein